MVQLHDILTRGVENVIPSTQKLEELLTGGKRLNIYFGIDPTATRIHLGHAVPLRKLQKLSELEHNVIFLIGDFTALIGDTSDKDSERPVLTIDEINDNFKSYKKQAEKIVDFSRVSVRYNSEWLSKLNFTDVVKLCQNFSVGDFIGRELIRKRLDSGTRVALHEVLYPVMQGYDSFFLDTDVQIGGTDQTFNMQAGRTLLKNLRQKESFVVSTGFLPGTDGRKMSKSWGNAIWLDDSSDEMFGKVMSLSDSVIVDYFSLGTNLSQEEVKKEEENLAKGENPKEVKLRLAHTIVTELHNDKEATRAQSKWLQTFSKKSPSFDETYQFSEDLNIAELAASFLGSASEAKRKLSEGAIDINDQRIVDPKTKVSDGDRIKIGKKTFITAKKV